MNRQQKRTKERELKKQLKNMKTNKTKTTVKENLNFEAIPTWDSNTTFTINGITLEYLTRMADTYRPLVQFVDAIILQGKMDGKVINQYVYEDNTLASFEDPRVKAEAEKEKEYINTWKEKLEERKRILNEQLENLKRTQEEMEKYSESILDSNGEPLHKEGKILNMNGETISSN